MAAISESECQLLKHILTSLGMIYNFEKSQERVENSGRLIKFLSILDAKNPSSENSLFSIDSERSKALRAYLCYALINWFSEKILKKEDLEKNNEILVNLIEKYIKDLLDKETVKHWIAMNEISKVETSLALSIGNKNIFFSSKLNFINNGYSRIY